MKIKRVFDIGAASCALLLFSPLFVLIALLVKLDSAGPVFYQAPRMGTRGAMIGPAITYGNDPRITRVGAWLRRFRLDELPQFLNVVKGDMSIVGPRPEAPEFVQLDLPIWQQVLSVRPGICGLTQLACAIDEAALLTNQATADTDYLTTILPVKLNSDLRYIARQSFFYDLYLLMQTALLLIRQKQPASLNM